MSNEFIKNRPTFDTLKLFAGNAIQYVIPEKSMMGESGRTYDCLIKAVTPMEITLSRYDYWGKLIDETFTPECFSGDGPQSYKLINPFGDTIALKTEMSKILKTNSLDEVKEIASEAIKNL